MKISDEALAGILTVIMMMAFSLSVIIAVITLKYIEKAEETKQIKYKYEIEKIHDQKISRGADTCR